MQEPGQDKVKKFEWMLDEAAPLSDNERDEYIPPYGDVTKLNSCRLIMDSVGAETLKEIGKYAVKLLDTSVAIYEANGDYAFGMFSSGWCRLMDFSSRKLCKTDDNQEALSCGKWLCHENCWNDSAKKAIETGRSTDIECVGGIHLYAEPIYAGKRVIGSINVGYGDPPKDPDHLKALADAFGVDPEKLKEMGESYKSRPKFIIDATKKLLGAFATLIGESVEKAEAEKSFRRNEKDLIETQRISHVGSWRLDVATNQVVWSEELYRMYGFDPSLPPPPYTEHMKLFTPESWEMLSTALAHTRETGIPYTLELEIVRKDESKGWVWVQGEADVDSAGKTVELWGAAQDITERKRVEESLREQLDFSESLIETAQTIILVLDTQGRIVRFNPYMEKLVGYNLDEVKGMDWFETFIKPEDGNTVKSVFQKARDHIQTRGNVNPIIAKDGRTILVEWYDKTLKDKDGRAVGILAIGYDITERKRAEAEQEKLQVQLIQAQKMESVGRLAGGVAHDFNNMLSVILGNTEMAMADMAPDDPLNDNLREIFSAAKRSADITRQLLAFARKQTIAPKVLDLNDTIESMLKMLRRLIGEDIDLAWLPRANIWQVRMDRSQIDQILANLCVNARDAITDVGKITIETGNATFDSAYCAEHPGFVAGDFVLLAVSDDGCGMDQDTLANLFEPFFTTKDVDKGTGLGLSTVYGIVKQNNGFINVYSEPDQGTTFRIYLPRHLAEAESPEKKNSDKINQDGSETILLVEDEPSILRMTRMMLERMGYKVLAAGRPGEAIALAREHDGEIHLLMTDVVMPEMNGRDLAKILLSFYPDLKRLFMSGYTANVIAHHGVLDEGVQFIQKPFSREQLGARVRKALDEDNLC